MTDTPRLTDAEIEALIGQHSGRAYIRNKIVAQWHVNTAAALRQQRDRIARMRSILRAILDSDERGQGTLFAEAMDIAKKEIDRVRAD